MRLSHKLSGNNKVVSSKHAGGPASGAAALMHGPAQPAGPGPAPQAPPQAAGPPSPAIGPGGFCNGGMKYADGGDVEQPTYWGAVKDRVKELTGLGNSTPTVPKAEQPKHGGKTYDDIVSNAETGKE